MSIELFAKVRHVDIIEALDTMSSKADFESAHWSMFEAEKLLTIAQRIHKRVQAYYSGYEVKDDS